MVVPEYPAIATVHSCKLQLWMYALRRTDDAPRGHWLHDDFTHWSRGSKRTRGEEVLAERGKHGREAAPPGGPQQVQPTEVPLAAGMRRATHAPGMR